MAGDVVPFVRPLPRQVRQRGRRPCSCDKCRRCELCNELIENLGVKQTDQCSFRDCPMRGLITVDDILAELGKHPFRVPAPAAPKKKP